MIWSYEEKQPDLDETSFIAPDAAVIGDVTIGALSSVWFHTTIRGDVNWIRIGEATNIQDNSVVHVTSHSAPVSIGNLVTVGHSAVIHGCTIHDRVLVGIGAIILDEAVVHSDCIIGAGALVTGRTEIPPRSMVLGRPGKVVRDLTDDEVETIAEHAERYVRYSKQYKAL